MRRPYIKTVSSTASSVLAGGIVPIGTTLVTGYCKAAMTLNGNSSVSINDNCVNGYLIAVNATFTAPAAGTVVLNVSRNGTLRLKEQRHLLWLARLTRKYSRCRLQRP